MDIFNSQWLLNMLAKSSKANVEKIAENLSDGYFQLTVAD